MSEPRRLKVRFIAEYEACILVGEDDDIADVIAGIAIPDNSPDCKYVVDTCNIKSVSEEGTGKVWL